MNDVIIQDSAKNDSGEDQIADVFEAGLKCESKRLYPKSDSRYTEWIDRLPDRVLDQENTFGDPWKEYAILLRTNVDHGDHHLHSVVIQSPLLRSKLNSVFKDYPSFFLAEDKNSIEAPFKPFVHYWDAFVSACDDASDTGRHMQLLKIALEPELQESFAVIEKFRKDGNIRFDQLWAIFKPGTFVYSLYRGTERIYKLSRVEARRGIDNTGRYFLLHLYSIDWDGEIYGHTLEMDAIEIFDGIKKYSDLGIYPLDMHPMKEAVIERLVERGKKFVSYAGVHYRAYDGFARDSNSGYFYTDEYPESLEQSDTNYTRQNLYMNLHTLTEQAIFSANKKKFEMAQLALTTDQLMICSPDVRGYSLTLNKWMSFKIDSLRDIEWSSNAFESLALPGNYKELLLAFAQTQGDSAAQFDDVIEGKGNTGKGMVVLLEGPPGLGKTLTVESLAEELKIPIYRLVSGQVRSEPHAMKAILEDAFLMTKAWNGILLLDEADIFLERRSVNELERNQLVSVFLQHLEYFEGIIFLTTNRVECIDPAFQSRIHLSLTYPELTRELRHKIWKNFIRTMKVDTSSITDAHLDKYASIDMNGRQIKNSVKMAGLLATKENHHLTPEHVETVLGLAR
ncbi:P-loop containing nucleoside triphosphate hydrolase protein [Thozetella sp. PMI_491]|nr:P-loop containing nucleoside triphosphate hydrolase protein [Thozetella sp. PMI_491]